jgi:hypothetical protein
MFTYPIITGILIAIAYTSVSYFLIMLFAAHLDKSEGEN